MEIFKGIHIIPGFDRDSNIYVIDNEVVVDTGSGEYFTHARNEIGKLDLSKIKLIVNTHYHFDNTGGNKKFRDWLHVPLASHDLDRPFIERGKTLAESFGSVARITTIDTTLKEGDLIRTEHFNLAVVHTPGHSAGSICLFEPSKKILISGDMLLDGTAGRTDLPGGNYHELRSSLEKLDRYSIHYLFPGHGTFKAGGINFMIKKLLATTETSTMI